MDWESREKIYLAPEAMVFWALRGTVAICVGTALLCFSAPTIIPADFWLDLNTVLVLILAAGAVCLAGHLGYVWLKYNNFFFILAENEIMIREGIIHTSRVILPYVKIQNITASHGVIESFLGVAKVMIDTAGGDPTKPEGVLPFVKGHEKLVDDLTRRADQAKKKGMKVGV